MYVDWDIPYLSLAVRYIFHLLIPLPLIMQEWQQKLEKSCFRCKKNTWYVELKYVLQPPKDLIIMVNRFRYINNNVTKDKYSTPMDMAIVLGQIQPASYHRSSWTIYVFCSLYYLYQLLQKHSNAMTAKSRSLKLLIPKSHLLHM